MKPNILFALLLIVGLGVPALWVYANVSTCGWKGLFVECRISR